MPEREIMHPAHARVHELLPWFENGTLDRAEAAEVETHLRECLVCRRELERIERLAAAVAVPAEDHACTQAYLRLAAQIRAPAATPAWPLRMLGALRGVFEPVPLIAGASLLIVSSLVVSVIVLDGQDTLVPVEQPFETLGREAPAAGPLAHPALRVVLRDGAGDAGLAAWLERHEAALVDGPSSIGVLTVEVALGARGFDAVLEEIRADEETLFVEPVQAVGSRPDRHR